MSAHVVNKSHIDRLVQAALVGCVDTEGRWSEYGPFGWVHGRQLKRLYGPRDSRADGTATDALTPSQFGQLLVNENVAASRGTTPTPAVTAVTFPDRASRTTTSPTCSSPKCPTRSTPAG